MLPSNTNNENSKHFSKSQDPIADFTITSTQKTDQNPNYNPYLVRRKARSIKYTKKVQENHGSTDPHRSSPEMCTSAAHPLQEFNEERINVAKNRNRAKLGKSRNEPQETREWERGGGKPWSMSAASCLIASWEAIAIVPRPIRRGNKNQINNQRCFLVLGSRLGPGGSRRRSRKAGQPRSLRPPLSFRLLQLHLQGGLNIKDLIK